MTDVTKIKLLLYNVHMHIRRNLCRPVLSVAPQRNCGIGPLTVEDSKSHTHTQTSAGAIGLLCSGDQPAADDDTYITNSQTRTLKPAEGFEMGIPASERLHS